MTRAPGDPQAAVLGEYLDGVGAITSLTATLDDEQWSMAACGTWSAAQLARHLLGVSDWYHAWLDRGQQGDASPPFPADDLPSRNDAEQARLAELPGPLAVEQFAARADEYAARLHDAWDVGFGYPFGSVTAGLHAPVAATEWHLHAWDLASALGADHRPEHPDVLLAGVVECFGVARGGVQGRVLRRFGPATTRLGDPWKALVRRSGRRPVRP